MADEGAARKNTVLKTPRLIFRLLLISLIPAVLLTGIFSTLNNTLYRNQRWTLTKLSLGRNVPYVYLPYYFSRNSLHRGHLDLGCWNGYHEVIYKDEITPSEIRYDFLLAENAHLTFVFDKGPDRFRGFRVSSAAKFKPLYLVSTDEGEFLETEELGIPPLEPRKWHRAKVLFSGDGETAFYVNGRLVKTFKSSGAARQRVGFRNGGQQVLVDNVFMRVREAPHVITERFDGRSAWIFSAILLIVTLFNGLAYLIMRRSGIALRHVFFYLVLAGLVVSICAGAYFIYEYYYVSGRYISLRKSKPFKEFESRYGKENELDSILKHIREKYAGAPSAGTVRVLFIGGSQTWGFGARTEAETFVRRIEDRLNGGDSGQKFECINTGIPSYKSYQLLRYYETEWLALQPSLVVVDLSYNDAVDKRTDQFFRSLRRFADINDSRNIKTIFVLEPTSPESGRTRTTHQVMRQVGKEKRILTVDLHRHLSRHDDKGFLWWDRIHLTSFGNKLTAEFLYPHILRMLSPASTEKT